MSLSIVAPERARRIPNKVLLDPARLALHGFQVTSNMFPMLDGRSRPSKRLLRNEKASQKTSGMTLKG
jgi:hypothetical protein